MKPEKKARMCGGAGLTAWRTIAKRNSVLIGKKNMALRSDNCGDYLALKRYFY
jgi:hypothetical protein